MIDDAVTFLIVLAVISVPFAVAGLLEDRVELRWADRLLRAGRPDQGGR